MVLVDVKHQTLTHSFHFSPRMVNIYNRLHKSMNILEYFTVREWEWTHNNLDALKGAMSPGDQRVSLNINNNLDALKGAMSPGDQRVSLNVNNDQDALKGAMSPGDQRVSPVLI